MSDPVIALEAVSFRYPGAARDSLRDVDLTVERGDVLAVVGGNGSGKTTLCKTFNGLVPHYWAGEFAGVARVDGLDTWDSSVAVLSERVGYVYQDFQHQLVRPTVRDELEFGPVNRGMADYRRRAAEAMEMLRITDLADRFVWQLSGGQAHLAALASVLAMRPSVVVVDEPVAELDPARAEDVYERLLVLNRELGLTVVTIEHHVEFVARFARSVVLMADGTPRWHLPVDEAMARTGELADHGIPAPQVVRAVQGLGVDAAPRTVERAAALLRPLLAGAPAPVPDGTATTSPTGGAAERVSGRAAGREVVARAVGVRHARRTVHGDLHVVLPGLDLDLHAGERVALVGANGAGKTTLLRMLAGIDVPREGTVELDGVDTRSAPAPRLADLASYLYQDPRRMLLTPSVREDVALFPRGRGRADTDELTERVLARVDLTDLADRDGRTLSGGQQRRATLAVGLAMRPRLLLLDEPTASLDVTSRDAVTALLADLAGTIACTVVATHDMQLVAEWASRVVVLEGGDVLADLPPADLFARPDLLTRAHLVPPQVTQLGLALGLDPVPLDVDGLVAAVAARRTDVVGAVAR